MAKILRIKAGSVIVKGELNESATAKAIWDALPIKAKANTWGDEIYFEIPVKEELAPDAREEVRKGEMGYWPVGRAFCIFFGPTPASLGDEPRAASAVNPIGFIKDDPLVLKQVKNGAEIILEACLEAGQIE
jgi:hypothetical protein